MLYSIFPEYDRKYFTNKDYLCILFELVSTWISKVYL